MTDKWPGWGVGMEKQTSDLLWSHSGDTEEEMPRRLEWRLRIIISSENMHSENVAKNSSVAEIPIKKTLLSVKLVGWVSKEMSLVTAEICPFGERGLFSLGSKLEAWKYRQIE